MERKGDHGRAGRPGCRPPRDHRTVACGTRKTALSTCLEAQESGLNGLRAPLATCWRSISTSPEILFGTIELDEIAAVPTRIMVVMPVSCRINIGIH